MDIPKDLELIRDGQRFVSLTFTLTLFTDLRLSTIPDAVLAAYDSFLKQCPPESLQFYLTENMQIHKPVTKRALSMLATWLKPGAPPRDYIALQLKDGELNWAPRFKFEVWGNEKEGNADAKLISMSFPPEWGWQRTGEMLSLIRGLCEVFPFRSGYAGFCLETSRYEKKLSQSHAWAKSMRYRGVDVFKFSIESIAVGLDGVKGVNWLTILDERFVKELGGPRKLRQSLPDAVELLPVNKGLVIQAGPRPQLGDTNRRQFLPEYKAVYQAIKPLVERAIERSPALMLGQTDNRDRTRSWLRRFDHD